MTCDFCGFDHPPFTYPDTGVATGEPCATLLREKAAREVEALAVAAPPPALALVPELPPESPVPEAAPVEAPVEPPAVVEPVLEDPAP
jgi:hypothetical protein